jgi:PAS domain S-box-containing protein
MSIPILQAPSRVLDNASAYHRLTFEVSSSPTAILTAEGGVVDVNRAALAFGGGEKNEVVGKLFWEASWWARAPEMRARMKAALLRCMQGDAVQDEAAFTAVDGVERVMEISMTPLCNAAGKLETIIVSGNDVTAGKAAVARLFKQEELFTLFEKNIDDLITVLDSHGRRIFNSDSYRRVLGDERVAPGLLSFDAVHPEDRERIREVFFNVVASGKGVRAEYRYQLEDGRIRYIESQSNAILDGDGNVYRVAVVGRDVTERKEAEEEKRRASALRQAIMRVATGAILYIRDRHILWMNDAWCNMVGYSRHEMEGMNMQRFYPSGEGFLSAKSAVYHEDGRARAEPHVVNFQRRNGEIFSAQVTGVPFDSGHPELGNVFSLSDITEQIAAQSEIKRLNNDLMRRVDERTAELQATNRQLKEEIAERGHYESALRESEEKYRMVVEYANEGLAVAQGQYLRFVNAKTAALIGRPLHEILCTPFVEFIHPEDRPRVIDNYRRRLAGETVENSYTFRFLRPDGESRWMKISAVAVEWEKQPAVLNFLSDVTERKASEDALRRSESRLHAMFNNAAVALSLADAEGRFLEVNESWAKTLGYGAEECKGMTVFDITHPEELLASQQNMALLLEGSIPSTRLEKRYVHKDGSLIWADVAVTPIKGADGGIEVMIGGFVDITERKRMEAALQDSRNFLYKVIDSISDPIFVKDREHCWVLMNDAFCTLFGRTREAMLGKSDHNFVSKEQADGFWEQDELAFNSGVTNVTEDVITGASSEPRYIQTKKPPFISTDGQALLVGVVRDITKRKRAEEDIQHALEKEKELNELKSKFVTMTSHEFRTPLSTILSSAELFEHYADKLSPADRAEILHSIQMAVKRMTGLLEDVLLIGQVEAGKMHFVPAPLDLIQFCTGLVHEFKRPLPANLRLKYRSPECLLSCPDTACCEVRADEKLLRHIFGNLLSNAIKYSPDGGEITFSLRCDGEVARIDVGDQGIGIPEADQKRLFETFHRAGNVGNIAGTGLGLSIVKYAVDQHGGSIECNSAPDQGTRFTVRLPISKEG